jgi:small-conductance mechanosensitive channel
VVHELLIGAAAGTTGVSSDPAPEVWQTALEDFYVRYELRVALDSPAERPKTIARLNAAIQDRFQSAGIQIMSLHYMADPAAREPRLPDRILPCIKITVTQRRRSRAVRHRFRVEIPPA